MSGDANLKSGHVLQIVDETGAAASILMTHFASGSDGSLFYCSRSS